MQQWATTEQGEYTDLYDPAIASLLTVPVADEWPDTRDGRAHVLTAGDPRAPPRVVFQGGNATIPRWGYVLGALHRSEMRDTGDGFRAGSATSRRRQYHLQSPE